MALSFIGDSRNADGAPGSAKLTPRGTDQPTIYYVYVNVNRARVCRRCFAPFSPQARARHWPADANFHRPRRSIPSHLLVALRLLEQSAPLLLGHTPMIAPLPLIRRACATVVFAALCCNAHAALPADVSPGPSVEGITEYDFSNGLRVLLFPDASQAKTTV